MASYAGYEMPIQYRSVLAEARAVRESAGVFDVSHMARLRLAGPGVLSLLEAILSNDVGPLSEGAGLYSLLPNKGVGCVDDLIAYRIGKEEYRLVANAVNHRQDVEWIHAENKHGVVIEDLTATTAMIAIQGPMAAKFTATMADDPDALLRLPSMHTLDLALAGIPCSVARSGYTGEDGFEITCKADVAEGLWARVRDAGAEACGLAARDILRVEAGLPLYGHELGPNLNPLAAGVGWAISQRKTFNGSEAINQAREEGLPQKLVGIVLDGKRVAEPGAAVYAAGRSIGSVTSGVFSPLLGHGIALAFVDSGHAPGDRVEVEIRGKREAGALASRRFYRRPSR